MANSVNFASQFDRWARRVRGRLALRRALSGVAIGLAIAVLVSVAAWRTRNGSVRVFAGTGAVAAVVGVALGLALARRRRWSDTEVALYLDGQLSSEEAITTAVEAHAAPQDQDPARAVVLSRAAGALASRDANKKGPALLRPIHALVPAATLLLFLIARAPAPPIPVHVDPPGVSRVQLAQADGLEKAIALARLDARDDTQRARLDAIAKDAAKLKAALAAGMERREAQDRLSHLRDAIAAERMSLGSGERRAGLESAVAKLGERDATKRAAQALGDHDLTAMDEQMEKLANEREAADRDSAKHALEEAAEAARNAGAPDVGRALEEQKRALGARGKRADMLRELREAMKASGMSNDDLESGSESLDRQGSDAAAKKLADAMAKALEKLTPEERTRLAQKLAEQARTKGIAKPDADALKDLAEELSSPEAQRKLLDELKDMAKDDDETEESKRERALDDAEKGEGGTEGQIGKQGNGHGEPGGGDPQAGPGQGEGHSGPGDGPAIPIPGAGGSGGKGPGHGGTHDTGTVDHAGKTEPVAADSLRSRAKGPMNKSAAMPGSVTTYTAGKAGGTANTRGTGDLKVVGPSEVDGVERSEVPEEYREHVRQYFQP